MTFFSDFFSALASWNVPAGSNSGAGTSGSSILNKWFADKADQSRFACPSCGKTYTTKSAMTAHFKYDCGKPPRFECPYCGKLSKKKFNVQDHIRHIHPTKPVFCNKLFQPKQQLRRQIFSQCIFVACSYSNYYHYYYY